MSQAGVTADDAEILRTVFAAERISPEAGAAIMQPYGQIASWIAARHHGHGRPLVAGICGAQGSGKSTLALGLAALIARRTGLHVVALSIDDFYLTRADRLALAANAHPLLATRGVPGTHDVALAEHIITRLTEATPDMETPLPHFDKATDDVTPHEDWPVSRGRADIVLFEGWCVGARAEPPEALATPVNLLERNDDARGVWRTAVNAALSGPYQALFARIDTLLMIAAPSFDAVFDWRREQERKLADRTRAAGLVTDAIMDDATIRRFIDHYERLTRHILNEMPRRADGVMTLDTNRAVTSLRLR